MIRSMETVVTLLIVGAVLLLLEIVLPGMIAGLIGMGCILAAIAASYFEFGAEVAGFVALGSLFAIVVGFLIWLKYFPTSRLGKLFVSESVVGDFDFNIPDIVGKEGKALSSLRPSGIAEVDGGRHDVVAESGLIERGSPVKVISVEGSKIVVRLIGEN